MLIAALHRRGIRLPRWIGIALLVLSSLTLISSVALGQGGGGAYGMLYLVGADTLGVERVLASPGLVIGDLQMRGQPRMQWTALERSPGVLHSLTIVVFQTAAPDAAVLQRAVLTLDGDTVRVELSKGGNQAIGTRRDALLFVPSSGAMANYLVTRARATPGTTDSIPIFLSAGGQTIDAVVTSTDSGGTIAVGPTLSTYTLSNTGRVMRVSVPSQRLEMVRMEGAAYAALRVGGPSYDAPAGAPYRAEHVKVPAKGGHILAATLTMPSGTSGRVPVVVTISGSGGQDRDEYIPLVPGYRPFRQYADSLGRRGIAVLRFDDRGVGESTGDHATATSADFADDVRSLVTWLRARPDIDPDRIMLMGHSEGGLIAPMVAATDPRLAGIVLLAGPGEKGEPILRFQIRNSIEKAEGFTAVQRDSALKTIDATIVSMKSSPWMRFFLDYDPLPTARRVKVPVYVVQGATDQQVLPGQAAMIERALREGGNTDVTVKVFTDRNHLFLDDPDGTPANYIKLPNGRIGGDVIGPVVDWVVTRARATRPGVIP